MFRRLPYGRKLHLGNTVVNKVHVKVGNGLSVIEAVVFARVRKGAKDGRFDAHFP